MKRRFAVPAAIALTAHAVLFLGLGKPPTPPSLSLTPTVVVKDTPPPVVEVITTPPSSDDNETACGGPVVEMAKRLLERPPVVSPGDNEATQNYVKMPPGEKNNLVGMEGIGGGGDGPPGLGIMTTVASMLDNPPRTRFQKAPVYPSAMKTTGTSGTVWVEFMVDEAGRVHDVRVLKSTDSEFEDATCDAVSFWRFEPGRRNGIPVRFRMSLPVVFNLTD